MTKTYLLTIKKKNTFQNSHLKRYAFYSVKGSSRGLHSSLSYAKIIETRSRSTLWVSRTNNYRIHKVIVSSVSDWAAPVNQPILAANAPDTITYVWTNQSDWLVDWSRPISAERVYVSIILNVKRTRTRPSILRINYFISYCESCSLFMLSQLLSPLGIKDLKLHQSQHFIHHYNNWLSILAITYLLLSDKQEDNKLSRNDSGIEFEI